MASSLSVDLEMEYFGWSENSSSINSIAPYDLNSSTKLDLVSFNSIVDNTMTFAIFIIIYIYCLLEFFFNLITHDIKINISFPRLSLFSPSDPIVFPTLGIK